MQKAAKSIEEIFPLIDFCKAGKLAEVTQWIEEKKPLDPPPAKRRSPRRMPLQIAIDRNFFSLAELLLDGGADPFANGNALESCVSKGRVEIAKLLLERGVPQNSVDLVFVCETGNPDMIRVFLEHGADPTKDFALYHAMIGITKPALGIFKEWKEAFPDLQEQLDAALLYFISEGKPRGVALCMWAGADPTVYAVDDPSRPHTDEWKECPLVLAAGMGDVAILKTLHPEKYPDLLPELMKNCRGGKKMVSYLLEIGGKLNDKENGGSALLESRVYEMGWKAEWRNGEELVGKALETIEFLTSKGAKWIPDNDREIANTRRNLRDLAGRQLAELVRMLRENDAAAVSVLDELLRTPKMKEVLGVYRSEVDQILHPKPRVRSAEESEEKVAAAKAEKVAKTPVAEVRKRAENFLIDFLCQYPTIPFWQSSLSHFPAPAATRKTLGLGRDESRDPVEILKTAASRIEKKLKSIQVEIKGSSYQGLCEISYKLKEGEDWKKVMEQAWHVMGRNPNPYLLTDVGAKTLAWLETPGNQNQFIKERSLSHRMGLKGRLSGMTDYLREIGNKTPTTVKWETKGERHSDPPLCYKLWLEDQELPQSPEQVLNPVLDFDLHEVTRNERDQVRDLILDHLMEVSPNGREKVTIFWVDSQSVLRACFPKVRFARFFGTRELPGFFRKLKFPAGVVIADNFQEGSPFWSVEVYPSGDWQETLDTIEIERNRPSLRDLYNLSEDAAKLLTWMGELGEENFEHGLTPIVDDHLKDEIGITVPWAKENTPAFLQILLDEINEKTPWEIRLQPWMHYHSSYSRLRVTKRENPREDALIRQIQHYALDLGKSITADEIKARLDQLIEQA